MEVFRKIEGYNGRYEISNHGTVISNYGSRKELKGHITNGYNQVQLTLRGVSKWFLVHRLVAEAFLPNAHTKEAVNHIDGDRLNNHYTNLEWCTLVENYNHAANCLKTVSLSKRGKAITLKEAQEIRAIRETGKTYLEIARMYSVSKGLIAHIVKNRKKVTL